MKKQLPIIGLGLVFGLLIYLFIAYSEEIGQRYSSAWLPLLSVATGVLVAYAIQTSTIFLNRFFSWKAQLGARLLSGILINSLLAFGILYILFRILLGPSPVEVEDSEGYFALYIKLAILVFLLVLIYSIAYFALYAYNQYNRVQIAQVRQDRRQINLQLRALKAQLRPHFLFNSLNTISSLLYQDANKAEIFIRKLAQSYQYTLSSYDKRLVSLAKELDFVHSYQFMLKTRYAEYLDLQVSLSEELLATKIPPLTLQMLVENAVKHNQMSDEHPLTIQIDGNQQYLWVRNNKTGKPAYRQQTSLKIGLKNINSRYRLLAKREIRIEDDQNFTVKLPVIK